MKFREKPVVIEAFQLTRETRQSNCDWPEWLHRAWNADPEDMGALFPATPGTATGELAIKTLEGEHLVSFDDWIIRGIKGELYPCKPDIFEMTYEPA